MTAHSQAAAYLRGSFCVRVLRRAGAGLIALIALAITLPAAVQAAHLGVSPTLIDVAAGVSVAGLRVMNGDAEQAVSVQARLVRWQQKDGGDVYTPATGVVASPPVTRVLPGTENLIRIVRTATHPVVGEESYRLLVDQLPESGNGQPTTGTIGLLIRHSVPVFFASAQATPAQPQWHITRVDQGWQVMVENQGDTRLRLSELTLYDEDDTPVAHRPGLVGYVLGHARMTFVLMPNEDAGANHVSPSALRLSARSETGQVETGLLPIASP